MNRSERNTEIIAAVTSGRTLQSVADEHGLTRERVRQIAKKSGVISSGATKAHGFRARYATKSERVEELPLSWGERRRTTLIDILLIFWSREVERFTGRAFSDQGRGLAYDWVNPELSPEFAKHIPPIGDPFCRFRRNRRMDVVGFECFVAGLGFDSALVQRLLSDFIARHTWMYEKPIRTEVSRIPDDEAVSAFVLMRKLYIRRKERIDALARRAEQRLTERWQDMPEPKRSEEIRSFTHSSLAYRGKCAVIRASKGEFYAQIRIPHWLFIIAPIT